MSDLMKRNMKTVETALNSFNRELVEQNNRLLEANQRITKLEQELLTTRQMLAFITNNGRGATVK